MSGALRIAAVTPDDAREFASWRYPAPYSVYDADPGGWEHYLDPRWDYLTVRDQAGELVGNCCTGEDARVPGGDYSEHAVDIGGGMRPELTGQGRGEQFLAAVIAEAVRRFPGEPIRVTVAAFNRRALRLAERAGFAEVSRFAAEGGHAFVILVRRA